MLCLLLGFSFPHPRVSHSNRIIIARIEGVFVRRPSPAVCFTQPLPTFGTCAHLQRGKFRCWSDSDLQYSSSSVGLDLLTHCFKNSFRLLAENMLTPNLGPPWTAVVLQSNSLTCFSGHGWPTLLNFSELSIALDRVKGDFYSCWIDFKQIFDMNIKYTAESKS